MKKIVIVKKKKKKKNIKNARKRIPSMCGYSRERFVHLRFNNNNNNNNTSARAEKYQAEI